MIKLKVTENHGSILFMKNTFFEKPQGGQIVKLPSRFRIKRY